MATGNAKELREKIEVPPPETNYIIFDFGYENKFVLPYDKSMDMLALLENAEMYDTSDYSDHTISPLKFKFEATIIGASRYNEMRVLHLINQKGTKNG